MLDAILRMIVKINAILAVLSGQNAGQD